MDEDAKPPETPPNSPRPQTRTVSSQELLGGAKEVLITHGDETYRLRLTRNGKLILHK